MLYASYMYVYAMCKLYLSVSYIMRVCYVQAIFICRLYVSNMLSMLWVHIQYTYYELLLLHDNYSKQLVVFLVGSSVDAFGMSTFNPGDLADMEVSDYIYPGYRSVFFIHCLRDLTGIVTPHLNSRLIYSCLLVLNIVIIESPILAG